MRWKEPRNQSQAVFDSSSKAADAGTLLESVSLSTYLASNTDKTKDCRSIRHLTPSPLPFSYIIRWKSHLLDPRNFNILDGTHADYQKHGPDNPFRPLDLCAKS